MEKIQLKTITVTGTGTAVAVPDLLSLSLTLECRRHDVASAYEGLGASVRQVTASLRRNGVQDSDISTTGINVRAEVDWREGQSRTVTGYLAGSTLEVRLSTPDPAQVVSDAVSAGANDIRLDGLVPGFLDESEILADAREEAWRNAEAAAAQLARLAGATLGEAESVMEHPPSQNVVPLAGIRRTASVEAVPAEAVPVEAGTSTASCVLTVTWGLRHPDAAARHSSDS